MSSHRVTTLIAGAVIAAGSAAAAEPVPHTLTYNNLTVELRGTDIWVTESDGVPIKLSNTAEAQRLRDLLQPGHQKVLLRMAGGGGNAIFWGQAPVKIDSKKPGADISDNTTQGMTPEADQREVRVPSIPNERKVDPAEKPPPSK